MAGISITAIKRLFLSSAFYRLSKNHMCTSNQIKRVSIEGNIAVGKSTFARLLQDSEPEWELITEPVSRWQNIQHNSQQSGSNLLQMMYSDPLRWSFTFQSFSLMSRVRSHLQPSHTQPSHTQPSHTQPSHTQPSHTQPAVRVLERSIYSDRYIFALNMFGLGFINATEWAVYQDTHSFLVEQLGQQLQLEGIVYLRAAPETCLQRVCVRGRVEEQSIDLSYLQKLHRRHEDWLIDKTTAVHFQQLRDLPVLVLDAEQPFDKDPAVQEDLISKVRSFFSGL